MDKVGCEANDRWWRGVQNRKTHKLLVAELHGGEKNPMVIGKGKRGEKKQKHAMSNGGANAAGLAWGSWTGSIFWQSTVTHLFPQQHLCWCSLSA
jgi:hypothetical protein